MLLDTVSVEAIVENLRSHFTGDEIYTFIGSVLISVNPYKDISGLYSSPKKFVHKNENANAPHVFAVAEVRYIDVLIAHLHFILI